MRYIGIVHLAGTTHADPEHLCRYPLQYPLFLTGVLPLYLSVVHTFMSRYPRFQETDFRLPTSSCVTAVATVQTELHRLSLSVRFNPGHGKFVWPPSTTII